MGSGEEGWRWDGGLWLDAGGLDVGGWRQEATQAAGGQLDAGGWILEAGPRMKEYG